MGFFWPTKLNHDSNALVRLGRVLHWIGSGLAAVSSGIGLFVALTQPSNAGIAFAFFGGFAALTYLACRALRYIFSGE